MKRFKIGCFIGATLLSVSATLILMNLFDKLVAMGGYAYFLAVLYFISVMASCLMLPVAFTKLQYAVSYKNAFLFTVKRYALTYIALPFFVMRFAGVGAWLPYLTNEGQLANPLYHQALWNTCAEWTSLAMVLILIAWLCLMALGLFGVLRYGYIALNTASALCLIPLGYLTLDYAAVPSAQNILLTALTLLCVVGAVVGTMAAKGQKTPPLRPFFAHADSDDLFWRKKREKERTFRSFK